MGFSFPKNNSYATISKPITKLQVVNQSFIGCLLLSSKWYMGRQCQRENIYDCYQGKDIKVPKETPKLGEELEIRYQPEVSD